jgi:glyoxylase-like metal-dependent hydrolase (beta-lactamase superfamily II)
MRQAGWDDRRLDEMRARGWGNFARMVAPLPIGHVRMEDGSEVQIGERRWTVMTGGGHTPEHACLIDKPGQVVIAGDQILPRITSNVSIMASEPTADPLREWLDSIAKFRAALTGDELILPAHGFPFTGVHARLDALAEGHHDRLDALEAALKERGDGASALSRICRACDLRRARWRRLVFGLNILSPSDIALRLRPYSRG